MRIFKINRTNSIIAVLLIVMALVLAGGIVPKAHAFDMGAVKMHRLYNPNSGEHFYTADSKERDSLTRVGWRYEGVGWIAPSNSKTPVYRLYNPYAGDHHYTTDVLERNSLITAGWRDEGIGWYSSDSNRNYPLYRQYNPNAWTGTHNYTLSIEENTSLVQNGWRAEGVGWYGIGPSEAAPSFAPYGTWFTVNGATLAGFDPSQGLDVPSTSYLDSAIYTVSGNVQIHGVPAGWSVGCDMRINGATGRWSAFYILKNGTNIYRWYFDGAADIVHTVDELRDVHLTVNGVEQTGYDTTGDVEIHNVYVGDSIGFVGWPNETWTVTQGFDSGNTGYHYIFQPKNASTPSITYRFVYDADTTQSEFEQVVARLNDGSLVTGFDGADSRMYDIPEGYTVNLENLPEGWTVATRQDTGSRVFIDLANGNYRHTFIFNKVPESSYTWTYE